MALNKTILVVDDYENARTLIKMALEGTGVQIIEAQNGEEAVSQYKNNPNIDLVLMDLNLPVMDGFEATQKIRELCPDAYIIAVTAYSGKSDKEKALEAGCNEVITKPFDIAFLVSAVTEYLKRE